jgi:hypothetical protein
MSPPSLVSTTASFQDYGQSPFYIGPGSAYFIAPNRILKLGIYGTTMRAVYPLKEANS